MHTYDINLNIQNFYNNGVVFFLASVFVIGSITGALVGGITGEKFGRKPALIIDNCIMIVGKVLPLVQNTRPFIYII